MAKTERQTNCLVTVSVAQRQELQLHHQVVTVKSACDINP